MMRFLCVVLFCLTLRTSQAVTGTKFFAVVFEGRPADRDIASNLETYKTSLSIVQKTTIDLIVLPEYGLTGMVGNDDLEKYSITFGTTIEEKNISAINDLAKSYKAHLVANILEKDGDKFYSTTIVVNGAKNIVAKYRKMNVDKNSKLSQGTEVVTFTTNFGEFGLMSGDEILRKSPSEALLALEKVNNIIITSSFKSQMPYKAAIGVQQGYAQAHGINLLVATLNDPEKGYGGSGIYSANKVIKSYIDANPASALLQESLEILKSRKTCEKPNARMFPLLTSGIPISKFKLEYKLDEMKIKKINGNINSTELCDGTLCCEFTVDADWNAQETYSMAVKGDNPRLCLILICDKENNNCGNYTESIQTKFRKIEIAASPDTKLFRPYSITPKLKPISDTNNPTYYCQDDSGVVFNVSADTSSVIAFGIVTSEEEISSANSIELMLGAKILTLLLVLKYFI